MLSPELLDQHLELRNLTRGFLWKAGIASNPGWTEANILDALSLTLGVEPDPDCMSVSDVLEDVVFDFRNRVASTLRAAGAIVDEPVTIQELEINFQLF